MVSLLGRLEASNTPTGKYCDDVIGDVVKSPVGLLCEPACDIKVALRTQVQASAKSHLLRSAVSIFGASTEVLLLASSFLTGMGICCLTFSLFLVQP
jgi:hypothetical protein